MRSPSPRQHHQPRWLHRGIALVAGVLLVPALANCSGDTVDDAAASGATTTPTIDVLASFYPLAYLAERVGGDLVGVTNMTKAGAEPHDLELAPQDVAGIGEASLVVFLSGFQPAIDAAVNDQAADKSFDAAEFGRLTLSFDEHAEGEEHSEEHADGDEHADGLDPHFWLDPTRLADVALALSQRLAEVDPVHAATYARNAATVSADLTTLDDEFTAGLATCTNRTMVVSHNAFGYLADRYDLTQRGISGLSPDDEPAAGELADLADFVRTNNVSTIYFETLASPAVAQTLAGETGAATAVLDPLEGLSDPAAGDDYLSVMRANLTTLQKGQPCP